MGIGKLSKWSHIFVNSWETDTYHKFVYLSCGKANLKGQVIILKALRTTALSRVGIMKNTGMKSGQEGILYESNMYNSRIWTAHRCATT